MTTSSRKNRTSRPGGWFGRIIIAALALVVIVLGGGYLMLKSYLHGDGFRMFLSNQVSRAADVRGEFSRFRWDGLAVNTDRFEAEGQGPLVRLRADGLHTEAGFGGVKRGVWELNGTSVQRLEAFIDAGKKSEGKELRVKKTPETRKERPRRWYPSEVEVKGFEIREANISALLGDGRPLAVKKVSLKATPGSAKNSYGFVLQGGSVELPEGLIRTIEPERIKGRYHDGTLFVTSGSAAVLGEGTLDASGEWDVRGGSYAFEGSASGIPCERLVRENWAKRVSGKASSSFVIEGRRGGSEAHGSLSIDGASLTALPVLDALSAYTDTGRFRVLDLDEARAEWKWTRGETEISEIVLSSEGLVRLEGTLRVMGDRLEGRFRLGLARSVFARIPGAETDVFLPGERGLFWTPVNLSGTPADPKEDLTDRLIAAAGVRMFESLPGGEKVFKFSQSVLGGATPEETIRRGLEVIEKGGDAVKEAKGILEGIFGGESQRKGKDR